MKRKYITIEKVTNGYVIVVNLDIGNKIVAVDANEVAEIIKKELKGGK